MMPCRTAFETAFSAWKGAWFAGGLAVSSDPHTRAVGSEFDALIGLGPTILPLLKRKMDRGGKCSPCERKTATPLRVEIGK